VCTLQSKAYKDAYHTGMIKTAAYVQGVPEKLMIALYTVESGLKPSAINWSKAGRPSVGLCQIEPSTARSVGFPCLFKGNYKELFNPSINAICAAAHLAKLLKKYKNEDHALAAYNLGHLKFNAKGEIWNRSYIRKVRKAMK